MMAMFTLIISTITVFIGLYWYLIPYNVLEIKSGNGEILNPVVKIGGYLRVRKVFCKNMNIPLTIDRKFIDGLEQNVPTINDYSAPNCFNTTELIYVPKALPPDTAMHLETTICAKVNPIRKICHIVTTSSFTITKE
jgi:hypothetical protein